MTEARSCVECFNRIWLEKWNIVLESIINVSFGSEMALTETYSIVIRHVQARFKAGLAIEIGTSRTPLL